MTESSLIVSEQRISPVRGLVPVHTARRKPLRVIDVLRWLRLNRTVYKTDKADLLALGGAADLSPEVLEYAGVLELSFSLRTDAAAPPPDLTRMRDEGLNDVFLCPEHSEAPHLSGWLDACRDAQLPVRVQFTGPLPPELDVVALTARLAEAGVRVVNLALADPFTPASPGAVAGYPNATLKLMNAFAPALTDAGIEANLVGLPFCLANRENWPHVQNPQQFFTDHQHYDQSAYELARLLYGRSPLVVNKVLLILLARYTSIPNPIDDEVFRFLIYKRPRIFARAVGIHKLTRHWRFLLGVPRQSRESSRERIEREVTRLQKRTMRKLGPECGQCNLRRICGHFTADVRRALPGISVRAVSEEKELVASRCHYAMAQPKYYDAIDQRRLEALQPDSGIVNRALELVTNRTPDCELDTYKMGVEHAYFEGMPGGLRWFSVTNTEKQSFPLKRVEPPFTLAVTFGGGIAEYIGFALGRHSRAVCPMEAYTHRLILHVEADGRYVLLRDGRPVQPVEFEGQYFVPQRIPGVVWPRISIWNIDLTIVTQTVQFWTSAAREEALQTTPRFSFLVVSTRYSRRLEAVLRGILRQEDVDPSEVEVVIAYVPGLDATEDVIQTFQVVHPDLRIVRSPFSMQHARSKGYLINESARLASGEWLIILDSDILLHPKTLAKLGAMGPDCKFVGPDGRKLLTKEVSSRILLGELDPWTDWNRLLQGPGEFRLRESGLPIGYFQAVRRECMETVRYVEYDHFEGADYQFAVDIREQFGWEKRLSGLPVLHLDHGGSQWYGTQRHF